MGRKILVVDDSDVILDLLNEELSSRGYEVTLAHGGEEALELFGRQRPDLITIDIAMPGMDGIALLQEIRRRDREIPVIMCSAYDHFKQDFNVWASEAYVVKSSQIVEDLLEKIQEILGQGAA